MRVNITSEKPAFAHQHEQVTIAAQLWDTDTWLVFLDYVHELADLSNSIGSALPHPEESMKLQKIVLWNIFKNVKSEIQAIDLKKPKLGSDTASQNQSIFFWSVMWQSSFMKHILVYI